MKKLNYKKYRQANIEWMKGYPFHYTKRHAMILAYLDCICLFFSLQFNRKYWEHHLLKEFPEWFEEK